MNLNNLEEATNFFLFGFLELFVLFLAISLLVEIINVFLNPQKVQKVLSLGKSGYLIASVMGLLHYFVVSQIYLLMMGLIKAKAIIMEYAGANNKWAIPFSAVVEVRFYIRAATMVGKDCL